MMSLETIRDLSKQAASRARRERKQPRVFTEAELADAKEGDLSNIGTLPNLGTYLPKGWSRVNVEAGHGVYEGDNAGHGAYLVDSSGFGRSGEAALTIDEFVDGLKPGLGYGIVENGQFQVKVGAYGVSRTR